MSPLATLETGLFLGLYALLAGIWGVLWALAQLRLMPIVAGSAVAAYALHVLAAVTIVLWTPLEFGWKCLIVSSSFAFLVIPPITWRLLRRTHDNERSEHDWQPSQHSRRLVVRL